MAVGVRLQQVSMPAFDRRRLLGVALAAVAGLLVFVVTLPAPQTAVLVAGEDIPAGQPLAAQDVAVRYVEDAEGFVVGSDLGELADWTLRSPVDAGEPLLPSLLQPPQLLAYPNVMALSLDQEHAVLGDLTAGDLVDVYRTSTSGLQSEAVTERIATAVYVVEVRVVDDGIGRDRVDLLLAVDEELAAVMTGAARAGEIDLVRIAP